MAALTSEWEDEDIHIFDQSQMQKTTIFCEK